MMDREQIIREAGYLFNEEVFEGLKSWYRYTLQGEWQYVVFTVRRSYILALIMETITGDKMKDSGSVEFLTDAAFFLRCQELADIYRKYKCFPPILLCDDAMVHGRNMNHLIEGIEKELCSLLDGEFEPDEVENALLDAVDVHVYVRSKGDLLLRSSYIWKLHFTCREGPAFLHQFSSDISSLILRANITNAVYVYTEYLSDADMERIRGSLEDYVETVYQNTKQYMKCEYIGSKDEIKAVFTLRIIENVERVGYRVAPFVLLPNLDSSETNIILRALMEKIPDAKCKEWLMETSQIPGKRTCNELITMLLSNVVLKIFNRKFSINPTEADREEELAKLARNYNQFGFGETKRMLGKLLGLELFRDIEALSGIFSQISLGKRRVMRLEEGPQGGALADTVKEEIKLRVEDYFYEKGCADEEAAYRLKNNLYLQSDRRSIRRARGVCFTMADLNRGYTEQKSRYCVAYFLQMMDAGGTTVSSYAPNNVHVVGLAQYTKAGEQSLMILPLRLYDYIPMLDRIEYEARHRLMDKKFVAWKFMNEYPEHYPSGTQGQILEFLDRLERMGSLVDDWDVNYIDKVEWEEEGKKVRKKEKGEKDEEEGEDLFGCIKNRKKHRKRYMDYAERAFQ